MTSFRFGVVSGSHGDGRAWGETARRMEASGYSALLVPDTLYTPSPFLALTAAAAATTELHLGTWVLAAPLRSPSEVVRETRTIVELSAGRFELGIGAGRPQGEQDAVALGRHWGTPRERVDLVQATLEAARAELGNALPITVAGSGDRMLRLAGRLADTVALPLPPTATMSDVAAQAERVRASTAEGRAPLGLALQISGKGKVMAERMQAQRARVNVSGLGNVVLWVSEDLAAHISGIGSVDYFGNPSVQRSVSGMGSINARGKKKASVDTR